LISLVPKSNTTTVTTFVNGHAMAIPCRVHVRRSCPHILCR
jgi:hypothetical protein